MTLLDKLRNIQVNLKAPKNLFNSFGKYRYRNAEGIQEAVKPFEREYNVTLTLEDDIVEVGGRIYVKATARLYDIETDETVIITGFAREADSKAGMDVAQLTGAASSYARKYALNGLFLLDDTKDPDTDEATEESDARELDSMKKDIIQLAFRAGVETKTICEQAKIKDLSELTTTKYAKIKTALLQKIGEKDGTDGTT